MQQDIKENVRNKTVWIRALYMLLFAIIFNLVELVLLLIVLFQFFSMLFSGTTNDKLLVLGQSLSSYVYQIMLFLTFKSEEHPYPMSDWPSGTSDGH